MITEDVSANVRGQFCFETEIKLFPGDYLVVVEQTEERRLTREQVSFKVVPRERRPGDRPERSPPD